MTPEEREKLDALIAKADHKPGDWALYHERGVKFVELSLENYRLAAWVVNALPALLDALDAAERKLEAATRGWKAARRQAWKKLPNEDGEDGETWAEAYADLDMAAKASVQELGQQNAQQAARIRVLTALLQSSDATLRRCHELVDLDSAVARTVRPAIDDNRKALAAEQAGGGDE